MIDFSQLTYDKKIAINCWTEDEVYEFVSEAKRQFPDACIGWSLSDLRFERYKENYCLTLYNTRGGKQRRLTYYYKDWFISNGYEIIPFTSFVTPDCGGFEPGELSVLLSEPGGSQ